MKLQLFLTGNVDEIQQHQRCGYISGDWDACSTSCVGLICEDGAFEYRDIYTNKFVRYRVVQNRSVIKLAWLHFKFLPNDRILFCFEDSKAVYKACFRNANDAVFPNNITHQDIQNNENQTFNIELQFKSPKVIKCFDTDLHFKHILCGLSSGDVLIGPTTERQQQHAQQEGLILIKHWHSTDTSTICGSLLNAFISSSKSQNDIKICDFDESSNKIELLYKLQDVESNGVTMVYPFRCSVTDNELVAVCTVEGLIFVYLLNDCYKLHTILNTQHQSEILDISSMNDGVILSVSTLNGFIYLFDTVHFNQISFQKVSDKPVIFAKYKKDNNDFFFIDYEGKYKLYSQTRPNTECGSSNAPSSSERAAEVAMSSTVGHPASIKRIDVNKARPSKETSRFTVSTVSSVGSSKPSETPRQQRSRKTIAPPSNVFSKTTISSGAVNRDRNIINPLKTSAILRQIDDNTSRRKESSDIGSGFYSQAKPSVLSQYLESKIEQVENSTFDGSSKSVAKTDQNVLQEKQNRHKQATKLEEQRRKAMQRMYSDLPVIPTKTDIMSKHHQPSHKIIKKSKTKAQTKPSIEPSMKPFFKRSLEPEKQRKLTRRATVMHKLNNKKTLSIQRKTRLLWSNTTFNQF